MSSDVFSCDIFAVFRDKNQIIYFNRSLLEVVDYFQALFNEDLYD
jgi:hypothetical protein